MRDKYRDEKKSLYAFARILSLILFNCYAWLCLGPNMQTFSLSSNAKQEFVSG